LEKANKAIERMAKRSVLRIGCLVIVMIIGIGVVWVSGRERDGRLKGRILSKAKSMASL